VGGAGTVTDDDLVKAREAERVMREYAAHPSSFTVPDSEQARSVADTIAALLDEMEALASIVNSPIVHEERNKLEGEIEALKAERDALARDAARVCLWSQDGDYESDTYGTSCGRYYCIIEGAPDENDMKYCCYCGGKLEQVLIEPDGGER